jgi:hypothetical protein
MVAVMALDRYISRLAKILVESEGISFDEAQNKLRALTLEVVVAPDATSPTAHAAVLTAVSVGRRTFLGGVRVVGAIDQPFNSALPVRASNLGVAAALVGSSSFDGPPSRRIIIGNASLQDDIWSVYTWWDGWRAGTSVGRQAQCENSHNPLVGIAAGALAVGSAFEAERGRQVELNSTVDLWPSVDGGVEAPEFDEVFLPSAVWLIGIGNLGQAFLWALASLPYADAKSVSLVLQDFDRINEENWATSVLVNDEAYGALKTHAGEKWALAKGFQVRRIDKRLLETDRLDNEDPRVALSGLDKLEPRRHLAKVGFDCIVDAGLGRTPNEFDRYRVTIFDHERPIDQHFAKEKDATARQDVPQNPAYHALEQAIGRCGAVEIAGASAAAPYVSAIAAVISISRLIALSSGCKVPANEVGKLSSLSARKISRVVNAGVRSIGHAGKPIVISITDTDAQSACSPMTDEDRTVET